ncbi:hypothetical protein [Massilia luteola]|jgi:hypothetical protein|uniref:hypothetical protein n=1 Tax=Massilia luteola TaxID=3081751 RepID=UPI002ACC1CF0|nr:hypothetical protein [Massilia sp. Gc5]
MSFSATLFQTPVMAFPFTHLLLVMVQLTLLGGVVMFFRPLLIGIARALVLVVRPRPTKDELAARRKQRTLAATVQAAPADVGVLGSH